MLYIRHAQKAYVNGAVKEFPLDPELTECGRKTAQNRFRELITLYGTPSRIICSPYLRARETAQIANDVVKDVTGNHLDIVCESQIGEFLGHHRGRDMNECLRPETLVHSPIPPEQFKQYSARIKKYVRSIGVPDFSNPIWVITHGIVIKSIAHFRGCDLDYPKELSGIRIDPYGINPV